MSEPKHTPGPWQWMFRGDEVTLCHPGHGHLLVMDFVRRGFNMATFRLAMWKGKERENMGGIMVPAHQLAVNDHPDARLIAAAPDLLAACELIVAGWGHQDGVSKAVEAARAVIAKAAG